MSFHPHDPVISVQSPQRGSYPMTVRTICVVPGQMLREGERIAELLEPSGRWVCLIATEVAGQIKAVRLRVGDELTGPTELASIFVARRPNPADAPSTGAVRRIALEALEAEVAPAPPRLPITPIRVLGRAGDDPSHPVDPEGLGQQFLQHKLLIAGCLLSIILAFGVVSTGTVQPHLDPPEVSMDQLWSEMRAARIAAAEAENARVGDDLSTRAADQKRALALARDGPPGNAACAGFFVGRQIPGWHVTRGVRRVTYLDPDRGVGAFIWTKSQVPGTFSCAHEQE